MPTASTRNMCNKRNKRNMKGKYFLDKIDGIVYSTNSYTLWNFYRSIFYGKPFLGEITKSIPGEVPNWDVITHNGKVISRKIDGKYVEAEL